MKMMIMINVAANGLFAIVEKDNEIGTEKEKETIQLR